MRECCDRCAADHFVCVQCSGNLRGVDLAREHARGKTARRGDAARTQTFMTLYCQPSNAYGSLVRGVPLHLRDHVLAHRCPRKQCEEKQGCEDLTEADPPGKALNTARIYGNPPARSQRVAGTLLRKPRYDRTLTPCTGPTFWAHAASLPRIRTSGCNRMPLCCFTMRCASAMSASTSDAVAPPVFAMKFACTGEICAPP